MRSKPQDSSLYRMVSIYWQREPSFSRRKLTDRTATLLIHQFCCDAIPDPVVHRWTICSCIFDPNCGSTLGTHYGSEELGT